MSVLERNRDMTVAYIHEEFREVDERTRWECIRCGWCCHQNWRINLTWWEYDRIISLEGKIHPDFEREIDTRNGMDHPFYVIRDRCTYLIEEGMICGLHPDWFYTCATYPFLLMPNGELLYHEGCKGIGHGKVVDRKKMIGKIISERRKAGMRV